VADSGLEGVSIGDDGDVTHYEPPPPPRAWTLGRRTRSALIGRGDQHQQLTAAHERAAMAPPVDPESMRLAWLFARIGLAGILFAAIMIWANLAGVFR